MNKKFHIDPGHAWLEVPYSELVKLGIEKEISYFSYLNYKNGKAYLEEDCDASIYVDAMTKLGKTIKFQRVYHKNRARIRNLPGYPGKED